MHLKLATISLFFTTLFSLVGTLETKSQPPSDLFISEYVEGSSNNKALEFFNGTGSAIDLTAGNYVVQYYYNGNTVAALTITLSGSVANNGVFILAQSSASFLTTNGGNVVADQTNSFGWFNGDDAIVLRKGGASGTVLDVIGQVGFDPGVEWGSGFASTMDNTLQRKAPDCSGYTDTTGTFDPSLKYDGFATDLFAGLGTHTASCIVAGATIKVVPSSLQFNILAGTPFAQQSYKVSGTSLAEDILVKVSPLAAFKISLNAAGPFIDSVYIAAAIANAAEVSVYVNFSPDTINIQSANIMHVSGSAYANVPLQGNVVSSITPIYNIQGSVAASLYDGNIVVTEGLVTADFQGRGQLSGFYLQDTIGDGNSATSDGIFVFDTSFQVAVGDYVRLTAEVDEYFNLTELKNISYDTILSSDNSLLPPVNISLPVSTISYLESYEGMLVSFPQSLTATEVFTLGRFGEISLSANGRLYNPTSIVDPNDEPASGTNSSGNNNVAAVTALQDSNNRSRILLDDGSNVQNPVIVPYLNPSDTTLRIGSTVANLTGVLDYAFSTYRVQPTDAPVFNYAARPVAPSVGAGNFKVASFNVLNYFNGDGAGGGFPTSRGAHTLAEFNRQRIKIINAINALNADVVGLTEIENDGDSANSAIADLVNGLNAVTSPGTYAYIPDPKGLNGNTGTDAIKQALIYKPAAASPVDLAKADTDTVHNRPPVAQRFSLKANGAEITVIINHFKSKSCTDATGLNLDQSDGQSCYNDARKKQAAALLSFIAKIQATPATSDVIAIGDFNAYEQEDPIDILRAGGLISATTGIYSYVFGGQTGSLDYAFVTPGLQAKITGADKWHINSDEPIVKDYNQEFNPAYLYSPDAYRSSDHDPVLVGLNLQPHLPSVNITSPANGASFLAGGNITINVSATDIDGSISKVEFYNGATLLYTATDTPYTFKWLKVNTGNYTLTAKAADNSGLVTTSDSINISVVSNKPPTVSIINPANGETFLKGGSIHLEAAAQDPDGKITKVAFYNGTTLLTTESKLPYTYDIKKVQLGNYILTVKATDNWGAETTSAVITVTVVPNKAPSVSIISPANGQNFTAPATINLEAAAEDPDGRITKVDFYNGTTLLTSVPERKLPYTYQWQNVPAGVYTLKAVAQDNWGETTTSAPVTVTVKSNAIVINKPSPLNNKTNTIRLQITPNPARNMVNIYTTGLQRDNQTTLSIISASGVILKIIKLAGSSQSILLDVSALVSGVYTIKIINAERIMYKKLVKM